MKNEILLAASGTALVFMTVNALWADWDFGSLEGFFLSISNGPIFPGVHVFSVIAVVLTTYWLVYAKKSWTQGVMFGLSIIAVHEFVWAFFEIGLTGRNTQITPFYSALYAVFLGLAILRGKTQDRNKIGLVALTLFILYIIYIFFPLPSEGIMDVIGWIVACVPWFT